MNFIKKFFTATWLKNSVIKKNLLFLITLVAVGFVYLINALIMDYKVAKISILEKKLKELKAKYSYTAMELNRLTLRSSVEKRVKDLQLNLKFPQKPPKFLKIKD